MKNLVKQERKPEFMKKILKSAIALILCAAAIITSINAGTGTVYAKGKKIPLKAGFNGTEIVLIKNLNSDGYSRKDTKIKTLEEKWGKPKKTDDNGINIYTWKKGKTYIEVGNNTNSGNYVGYIRINIKDKNGSLSGVKVGMKKSTALKKLKKLAGNKNIIVIKDGQDVQFDENNNYIIEGEPESDDESIWLVSKYMPASFELKNGKISSISWFRS